jgi:nicotinamidase-related amidase
MLGVETMIVTDVATNICVTQTAREFADRGFTADSLIAFDSTLAPDTPLAALIDVPKSEKG